MRPLKTCFLTMLLAAAIGGPASAQTTLRMTWYSDGNEGEVMSDLLKLFEAQNKDVKAILDQVPFQARNESMPCKVASGQGTASGSG